MDLEEVMEEATEEAMEAMDLGESVVEALEVVVAPVLGALPYLAKQH